jgi:hypothetical protein
VNVWEIQKAVLECLLAAGVPRILKTTLYSISNDPSEVGVVKRANQNKVLVTVVASYDEFMAFRACANVRGVWIIPAWQPFGQSDRFIYEIVAVEKR